jgi:hypothetical protein
MLSGYGISAAGHIGTGRKEMSYATFDDFGVGLRRRFGLVGRFGGGGVVGGWMRYGK